MRRLSMKKYRKILLLRWEQDISVTTILKMIPELGRSTAYDCLQRAMVAGLTVAKIKSLSDFDLEQLLYPPKPADDSTRPEPDYVHIHKELAKNINRLTSTCMNKVYMKQLRPVQ